jgi:hypothetical protein
MDRLGNFPRSNRNVINGEICDRTGGLIVWAINAAVLVCCGRQEVCWEGADLFRLLLAAELRGALPNGLRFCDC